MFKINFLYFPVLVRLHIAKYEAKHSLIGRPKTATGIFRDATEQTIGLNR